ncbi:MAG: hypothetical protein ACQES9_09450 [Myxococcota bacterium]
MKNNNQLAAFVFMLFFTFIISEVKAYEPWEHPGGARGLALGGGVIASGTGSDALVANPAAMSLIRSYIWENYYSFSSFDKGHTGTTSLVDSYLNPKIAAGSYFTTTFASPEIYVDGTSKKLDEKFMKGGLAVSMLLGKMFALGFNGYYYKFDREGSEERSFISLDIGMIVKIGEYLSIGAVAYDLISDHNDDHPWSYGGGVALSLFKKQFLMEFDVVMEGKEPWYKGGAELFFSKGLALRAGGGYRQCYDRAYLAFGIGYVTKKSSVELSMSQGLQGGKNTIVGIDLRFFLK